MIEVSIPSMEREVDEAGKSRKVSTQLDFYLDFALFSSVKHVVCHHYHFVAVLFWLYSCVLKVKCDAR